MNSDAYKQIVRMTKSEVPRIRNMALALIDPNRTMESMLRAWHIGMGAPVRTVPTELSVQDIERRLRLSLEENLETIKGSGFKIVSKTTGEDLTNDLMLVPIPGAKQDLVETADGNADVIVVALGHAVEHGFPISAIFDEVMWSNGTKLPPDGISIINRCTTGDVNSNHDCDTDAEYCDLLDPTAPKGKILKPPTYVKADIKTILEAQGKVDTSQDMFVFAS